MYFISYRAKHLGQDNYHTVYISHFVFLLSESKANTSGPTELKLYHTIPATASMGSSVLEFHLPAHIVSIQFHLGDEY